MVGTLINVATVMVGGGIGLALGAKLPERFQKTILQCMGLFTLFIGIQMASELSGVTLLLREHCETTLQKLAPEQASARLWMERLKSASAILPALVLLLSLVFGALIGEWLRIQDGLDALGEKLRQRFDRGQGGRFTEGFVTTSLLFCVGPMTIMGSINDGLRGDFQLLAIKSIMDGFSAMAFAAELGVGVLFSTLTVLVVQGALTLGAGVFQNLLSVAMQLEMTAVGGLLIIGLGLGLLEIKKMRIANFLPALIVAPGLIGFIERLCH